MRTCNPFTPEQIEQLLSNPYTHTVTTTAITFTKEFKEFFYEQMQEGQLTTAKIFEKAGYDPSIFGRARMDMIRIRIRKEAASSEGFKAPSRMSYTQKKQLETEKAEKAKSAEIKIKSLQDRIAHLEAQMEFLKKTEVIRANYQKKNEKTEQ